MPMRRREPSTAAELAALLEAGDNRAAARRARQIVSEVERGDDRDAALAALARVRPDLAGMLVAGVGLLFFAGAALFGLFRP